MKKVYPALPAKLCRSANLRPQSADQFHADELPTKAGVDKLDKLRFRDFDAMYTSRNTPILPSSLPRPQKMAPALTR